MEVEPVYKESIQLSWIAIILLTAISYGYFLIAYVPFRVISVFFTGSHHCPLCNYNFGKATRFLNNHTWGD